jgi:hypothetical protein
MATVLAHPSAVAPEPVEIEEFDAPNDLTMDERHVWMELAPHAFKSRTLTKASSLAFRMLCRNVVLEKMYATSVTDRGGASHRGLIQRVDAELLAFGLAPCGKPMADATPAKQAPVNPLERFLTRTHA